MCIETASTNCSVAIASQGKLLGIKEDFSQSFSHAERLHVFIEALLKEHALQLSQLDAIAISKGPGSYTGLRIGVSAAKGLCYSLDIPLVSVATLTALALQVKDDATVVPMLDARRMEVYTGVFNGERRQIEETSAMILEPDSYRTFLEEGPVYFIGSGVEKFMEICKHPNARFITGKLPSAREMVPLASEKYEAGMFEDVAYFEPYYLKDFMAG